MEFGVFLGSVVDIIRNTGCTCKVTVVRFCYLTATTLKLFYRCLLFTNQLNVCQQFLIYRNITTPSLSCAHEQCHRRKKVYKKSTLVRRRLYFASLSLRTSLWWPLSSAKFNGESTNKIENDVDICKSLQVVNGIQQNAEDQCPWIYNCPEEEKICRLQQNHLLLPKISRTLTVINRASRWKTRSHVIPKMSFLKFKKATRPIKKKATYLVSLFLKLRIVPKKETLVDTKLTIQYTHGEQSWPHTDLRQRIMASMSL